GRADEGPPWRVGRPGGNLRVHGRARWYSLAPFWCRRVRLTTRRAPPDPADLLRLDRPQGHRLAPRTGVEGVGGAQLLAGRLQLPFAGRFGGGLGRPDLPRGHGGGGPQASAGAARLPGDPERPPCRGAVPEDPAGAAVRPRQRRGVHAVSGPPRLI